MRYSFTPPLPKSSISKLTKIWIFYFILTSTIFYFAGIQLELQRNNLNIELQIIESNIKDSQEEQAKIALTIERLEFEKNILKEDIKHNEDLILTINHLLDLIPPQITLSSIELSEHKLTIKGVTPTREAATLLLTAPLRSYFNTSEANFLERPDGWFNFTSISVLDNK